jgi:hypothetical protein
MAAGSWPAASFLTDMRKAITTFLTAAAFACAAWSATPELGQDIMQNIEDLNKSLASNIALRDSKGSTADAKEIHDLFAQVEAHFIERGDAANGVDLSKKTRVLAMQIVQQIAAKDFTAATDTATDLSRTCKTCHTFYKKE